MAASSEQLLGPPLADDVDRAPVAKQRIEAEEPLLRCLRLVQTKE
jgi:hypothetical protein